MPGRLHRCVERQDLRLGGELVGSFHDPDDGVHRPAKLSGLVGGLPQGIPQLVDHGAGLGERPALGSGQGLGGFPEGDDPLGRRDILGRALKDRGEQALGIADLADLAPRADGHAGDRADDLVTAGRHLLAHRRQIAGTGTDGAGLLDRRLDHSAESMAHGAHRVRQGRQFGRHRPEVGWAKVALPKAAGRLDQALQWRVNGADGQEGRAKAQRGRNGEKGPDHRLAFPGPFPERGCVR